MVFKRFLQGLLAIGLVLGLQACSGVGGSTLPLIGGDSSSGSGPGGDPATIDEGTAPLEDDGSESTDTQVVPTTPIPISHLENENIIISAPDNAQFAVIQAQNLDANYLLRVENITELAHVGARHAVPVLINTIRHSIFPTAIADTEDTVCTGANIWCFEINDDGSVTPQVLEGTQVGDSFALSYVLPKDLSQHGEEVEDASLTNVIYTAVNPASANALTSNGTNALFQAGEGGNVTEVNFDSSAERFIVSGMFDYNYALTNFGLNISELAFHPSNSQYIIQYDDQVVSKYFDTATMTYVTAETSVDECNPDPSVPNGGCKPKHIKFVNRSGYKAYIMTDYSATAPQDEGKILELYNSSNEIIFKPTSENTLQYIQTLAFDTDANKNAVIFFEDGAGDVRVRGVRYSLPVGIYGDTNLSSLISDPLQIIDFHIHSFYDYANAPVVDGYGLLLISNDESSGMVYLLNYNVTKIYSPYPSIALTTSFSVGNNPQKLVLSSDSGYAFVLNKGSLQNSTDDTISVFNLNDPANPVKEDDIFIRNYIGNKSLDIDGEALEFINQNGQDYLVIGSSNLKSSIIIPWNP